MNIRAKFILIVLPLVLTPLALTGIASSLSARNGITRVATEFLKFKARELENYAESQWSFLVENRLGANAEFIESMKAAVVSFARSIIGSETELTLAVTDAGEIAFSTEEISPSEQESEALRELAVGGADGWREVKIQDTERVAACFSFAPFGWYFLVSEQKASFYEAINQIYRLTGIISGATVLLIVSLLFLFASYLTRPMHDVLRAMQAGISRTDLSGRVPIMYRDETGELAHTFNLMIGELEKAYNQIKGYALKAAIARTREEKIRSIFQRYVPKDVIDELFADPDSMLVGKNQEVAVLFCDIRGFTEITESLRPEETVESLNAYFSIMVDIITRYQGIVDKYIGDKIMAIYGAPTSRRDDAVRAVRSALEMLQALEDFNRWQRKKNRLPFGVGMGINYGAVTVGNIGSEKKMDYTVVGDMVNLASRLESLTRIYNENLLISESTYQYVKNDFKARMMDRVIVKGKTTAVGIFTVRKRLRAVEEKAWGLYEDGLALFYDRQFDEAAIYFREIQKLLPGDQPSKIFLDRCHRYLKSPPADSWTGVIQIDVK